MRTTLIVATAIMLALNSTVGALAAHQVSSCGDLLEYSPPPGSDPTSGLGRIRIASASGEVTYFFHPTNASNAQSVVEPGATRVGERVCFTGTHIQSASPVRSDYVSPYRLTASPAGGLPSTSTSVDESAIELGVLALVRLSAALLAYAAVALARGGAPGSVNHVRRPPPRRSPPRGFRSSS